MFENLENAMCDELEKIDDKYRNGMEISAGDLQKADMLFHALKSAETYKAMKEGGEDDGTSERSYARGRSRTTGRYTSGPCRGWAASRSCPYCSSASARRWRCE